MLKIAGTKCGFMGAHFLDMFQLSPYPAPNETSHAPEPPDATRCPQVSHALCVAVILYCDTLFVCQLRFGFFVQLWVLVGWCC